MHGLIVEDRPFGANPSMKDLARHLYARMSCGQVVIVTDKPLVTLSLLRKEWLKLIRKVQVERASTLDARRIYELTHILTKMHSLRFMANWPPDEYKAADVYIVAVDQLLRWAPECRTMYVTSKITNKQLHMITTRMLRSSLIVTCTAIL